MMLPEPPPVFVIPGMFVGCLPYYALRFSTLECLFNLSCLNATVHWISSQPSDAFPKPLNSSLLLGFSTTSTFYDVFDNYMVETWENITNFSAYYTACSPIECTYTVNVHSSTIYILTTLLSSYGGLMVVLRIIAPQMVGLYWRIKRFSLQRNRPTIDHTKTKTGINTLYDLD